MTTLGVLAGRGDGCTEPLCPEGLPPSQPSWRGDALKGHRKPCPAGQLSGAYLVQDIMTFCNSENQVDVVFSQFLPKKRQGRIILGAKKLNKNQERLMGSTETKVHFTVLLPTARLVIEMWCFTAARSP